MAVLASNTFYKTSDRGEIRLTVTNGVTLYAGSLVFLSDSTGLVATWSDAAAVKFVGIAKDKVVGTGSNQVVVNDTGIVLEQVTVTGVDNQNDVGDLVYATNDNPNDMTLTANTNQKAVGRVTFYYGSGTKCNVLLFTSSEHVALY